MEVEYYRFLGVSIGASPEEIRRAYKKKVPQYHPDKNPGEEENFKKLQKVYDVLSNEEKRAVYDRGGEEALEKGPNPFEQMGRREKGENFVRKIGVDLDDLYKGLTKKLKVTKRMLCTACKGVGAMDKSSVVQCRTCQGMGRQVRIIQQGFMIQQVAVPCDACKGSGERIRDPCKTCRAEKTMQGTKEITIIIDPGRSEGEKIVLSGEADQEPGVPPGDIIFIIHQLDHPIFVRKGNDLYMKKKITLREALTGLAFDVRHMDGRVLRIQTAPGEIIHPGVSKCIAGEGMPTYKQIFKKGRLFIDFDVEFPAKGSLNAAAIDGLKNALPESKAGAVPLAAEHEDTELQDVTAEMLCDSDHEKAKDRKEVYDDDDDHEDHRHPGVQCAHQ